MPSLPATAVRPQCHQAVSLPGIPAGPAVPSTRRKPARKVAWVLRPDDEHASGVISITEGRQTDYYCVEPIPCDMGGRAFRLLKHVPGAEPYHVRIDNPPQDFSCECVGFLAHSHCRHVDSLIALMARGQL
jgi:hypothetical protein